MRLNVNTISYIIVIFASSNYQPIVLELLQAKFFEIDLHRPFFEETIYRL
jgi:hypothetical protein